MSWKCDICDSYNEESTRQCYVCGQPRSRASIREGRIRARAGRIKRVNEMIVSRALGMLNIMYTLGVFLALAGVVMTLIFKSGGTRLDDIWQASKVMLERAHYNYNSAFNENLSGIMTRIGDNHSGNLAANVKAMGDIAFIHIIMLGAIFEGLMKNAGDSFGGLFEIITELYKNITRHF